jgi:hypothetical protein
MGGGGGILTPVTNVLFGKPPAPPPAPDYRGAAAETAAGNLAAAQSATAANRVNQITPYGNLSYAETGVDSRGNPTWTATQTLSPAQQQILDMQNQTSIGLGSTINASLGRVQDVMGQGFNPNLPSTGFDPGQSYQDAYMQRLAPQLEQNREATQARLANQGIVQGTQAYDNAMRQQAQRENDLLLGATTQGFGVGSQANQQAFNQELTKYNLPLNTLSALRTGAQVQNPSFVNAPQQATTSGADILGASQMGYNAQMGDFNAQAAERNNMMQGLFGLGGAGIMKYSDIRMKENITQVHWLPNGLPVYTYEYKPEFKNIAGHGVHIGVMAQEVEMFKPEAVITNSNGYKMVNYGLLT